MTLCVRRTEKVHRLNNRAQRFIVKLFSKNVLFRVWTKADRCGFTPALAF